MSVFCPFSKTLGCVAAGRLKRKVSRIRSNARGGGKNAENLLNFLTEMSRNEENLLEYNTKRGGKQ